MSSNVLPSNINVTRITTPTQGINIFSPTSIGSVTNTGDVNGDGYEDVLISQGYVSYLIWGDNNLKDIDTNNLVSSQGIKITSSNYKLRCVGVEDVNNDGYNDILCSIASAGTLYEGINYLIFGKKSGWIDINLNDFTSTNGITITGASYYDGSGTWISWGEDVNHDGYADFLIGTSHTSSGYNSGTMYLLFGGSEMQDINLGVVDTTQWVQISSATYINKGSGIGDVNGDGYGDLLIDTEHIKYDTGASSIIFGHKTWSNMNLSNYSLPECVTIQDSNNYNYNSWSTNAALDINNDGYDDILMSTNDSITYAIYGKGSEWQNMDLAYFNYSEGFTIISPSYYEYSGASVIYAFDVNNDGYDDFAIGASKTGNVGDSLVYLFLGGKDLQNVNLANFDAYNGVLFDGIGGFYSFVGVEDVNGDGYGDFLIADDTGYLIYGGEVEPVVPTPIPTNKPTSRPIHPTKPTTTTTMSPTPEGYTYPPTTEEHHHSSDSLTSESWFVPTVATISSVVGVVCLAGLGWYAWNHYHKNTDQPFELIEN